MTSRATFAGTRIAEIIGSENLIEDPQQLIRYAVDGKIPGVAARPRTPREVAELVKFAAAENQAIVPIGARTKLGIGMPPARYDLAVDMARLDRVISYDPGDLTLSVEPGISLCGLGSILEEHNQFLPLEMPFFERATVGGTLASGVDSPLRQAYGTPRDFILGMEFVTGEGALAKSGGRVVKNVSGYDLHKLMLGAIGSLGIITGVNFKTFPMPRGTATFIAFFSSIESTAQFNLLVRKSAVRWQSIEILTPEAISLVNVAFSSVLQQSESAGRFSMILRAAGNEAALARAETDLHVLMARNVHESGGNLLRLENNQERRLCAAIREFPSWINTGAAAATLKIACLPSKLVSVFSETTKLAKQHSLEVAHLFRGCGVCYCVLFAKPDGFSNLVACCKELLSAVDLNSSASVPWCPPEAKHELNIWGAPREESSLMQRVKRAFDPQNILAPGRYVGGL